MQKLFKILSIRIIFAIGIAGLSGCSAPPGQQASDNVGPVSSYARNSMAAENPSGLIRIAEGFERSGDFAGARALYTQALAAIPSMLQARIGLARANAKLGLSDSAVADLTLLLAEDPGNRTAIVTLAQIHAADGRYQTALTQLLAIDELSPVELVLRGKLRHVTGASQAGHADIMSALDLMPNQSDFITDAGLSFALIEDYAGSIALLRRSLDRPTFGSRAEQSLALVYALSGQRQLALRLARDILPPEELQRLEPYFRYLPQFSKQEQAAALFFDRIPNETIARFLQNATN